MPEVDFQQSNKASVGDRRIFWVGERSMRKIPFVLMKNRIENIFVRDLNWRIEE